MKYRALTRPFTVKKGDQFRDNEHDWPWRNLETSIGKYRGKDWMHSYKYRRPIRTTTKKGKLK